MSNPALRKKGGVYYLRIRRCGWDNLVSTGQTSRRSAEAAARRILSELDAEKTARALSSLVCRYAVELARGEVAMEELTGPLGTMERREYQRCLDIISEIFPRSVTTASEVFEAYKACPLEDRAKERTIKGREAHFASFAKWAKDRDVGTMDVAMCRKALDDLGLSGQTRNNYISDLSVVFSRAGIDAPWKKLREPASHKERKPLDMETARHLLAWCNDNPDVLASGIPAFRWASFIRVLYYTGLRPSDACLLSRSEVKNGAVELMPEKTSRARKKVSFLADPSLLPVLDALPEDPSGLFFPDFAALFRKNNSALTAGFSALLQKAGLPSGSMQLYALRHNFVTCQIDSGADLEDVSAAVGHVSTSTTGEFYYHGRRRVSLPGMAPI